MPFASVVGAIAAPVVGGLVSSALGPSTSGGSGGPNYYTPTGLSQADQQWQDIQNRNYQRYMDADLTTYGLQSLYDTLTTGQNFAPWLQRASGNVGIAYDQLAQQMQQQSGQNFGTQQSLLGAGQDIYGLARDPQSALYNRTAQQLQEQTGATNAMYGLGSSAAGAGVANQAMSNFNIDWQNNQLQRALQGLGGYTGAAQTAGGYGQLGTAQAQAAPGYYEQAGTVPLNMNLALAGIPGQAGSAYGQYMNQNVYGPGQSIQGQAIPYMNYGQGAQSVPYQQAQQGAGALGSMVSQGIQGLGSTAQNQGWLSNMWGGNSAFGGSSGWSDYGGFGGASPVTGLAGGGANYSFAPSSGAYGIY